MSFLTFVYQPQSESQPLISVRAESRQTVSLYLPALFNDQTQRACHERQGQNIGKHHMRGSTRALALQCLIQYQLTAFDSLMSMADFYIEWHRENVAFFKVRCIGFFLRLKNECHFRYTQGSICFPAWFNHDLFCNFHVTWSQHTHWFLPLTSRHLLFLHLLGSSTFPGVRTNCFVAF